MDGTLYDEAEFIIQPYQQIAELLGGHESYLYMVNRWFEKGSSYNKIFDEVYDLYEGAKPVKEQFIKDALHLFRHYEPQLQISARSAEVLNFFARHYTLFLVTDGNPQLQRMKFLQLGLDKYFSKDRTVFTGDHGAEYHKPNTKSMNLLDIDAKKAVFFGDRHFDEGFAKNTGMQFQKVYNMISR